MGISASLSAPLSFGREFEYGGPSCNLRAFLPSCELENMRICGKNCFLLLAASSFFVALSFASSKCSGSFALRSAVSSDFRAQQQASRTLSKGELSAAHPRSKIARAIQYRDSDSVKCLSPVANSSVLIPSSPRTARGYATTGGSKTLSSSFVIFW